MIFKDKWRLMDGKDKHNLADSVGVTYTYLSHVANGTRNTTPSKSLKELISVKLDSPISELFVDKNV